MASLVLNVPDISCAHCAGAINDALAPVEGIRDVRVDVPAQQVHVDYDEARVGVARMREVLEAEEYPVASVEPAPAPGS